jgi:hypothetical protein
MKKIIEFEEILTETRANKLLESDDAFLNAMEQAANGAGTDPAVMVAKVANLGNEEYDDTRDPESPAFSGDLSWTGANKVEA